MDLEDLITISVLGSAVLFGLSYLVGIEFKRIEKRKKELYEVMESLPEEHRQSVKKVLGVLEKQHPHDNVSYRIRNFLKDYNSS